jgi:hypothetical protein
VPGSDRPLEDVPAGDTSADGTGTAGGVGRWLFDNALTIGALLTVLVILLLVPGAAWVARRRARAAARDEAERVEAEWESLVLRLGDIGVTAADGATPRQASAQLGRAAYLTTEEGAALGRVVATLERARYEPPGGQVGSVEEDARTVWRGALSRRRRLDRARALLLPEEGLRWWRALLGRPGDRAGDDDDRSP